MVTARDHGPKDCALAVDRQGVPPLAERRAFADTLAEGILGHSTGDASPHLVPLAQQLIARA
jgi:hypothetical protein